MSPVDALKRIDSLIEDLTSELNANIDNRDEMLEAYTFYTALIFKTVREAMPTDRNLPA